MLINEVKATHTYTIYLLTLYLKVLRATFHYLQDCEGEKERVKKSVATLVFVIIEGKVDNQGLHNLAAAPSHSARRFT